jgi:excisionase family DNA binding protein
MSDLDEVVRAARLVGGWLGESLVRIVARSAVEVTKVGEVFLTVDEVARMLQCSQSSVRSYLRDGHLHAARSKTGRVRIKQSDVIKFRDLREGHDGFVNQPTESELLGAMEAARQEIYLAPGQNRPTFGPGGVAAS